jgi:CRP/FNR family cyclic AMP-dependent transcriptional regulator
MRIELFDRPETLAAPDVVQRIGWLAGCHADFRTWVLHALHWRLVQPGTGLSFSGDREGGLFCLAQGQIGFQTCLGGSLVTSGFGHPGAWWGHAPLLGLPRTGTVTARTECIIGILPQRSLETRLAEQPGDWADIALGLSDIHIMSAGAHADLLIESSRNRVAATLLRLGGNRHRRFPLRVPRVFECTQDELARATGLSRNTAGFHLRSLERGGLVRIGYGEIELLDTQALTEMANADS